MNEKQNTIHLYIIYSTIFFSFSFTYFQTSALTQLADHKRRHCRYQRQQLHELQLSQRQLKRQFNELKYHRIAERVRSIEIEQHRIADANFNLSVSDIFFSFFFTFITLLKKKSTKRIFYLFIFKTGYICQNHFIYKSCFEK